MRLMILTAALTLISGLVQAVDWSGSTVGGHVGALDPAFGSVSNTSDGSARYGVRGRRDIILGRLVFGAEIAFNRIDLRHIASGVEIGDARRLKSCAGRDFGRRFDPGLTYAIVGCVNGILRKIHETGVVFGLGLSTPVGNHLRLSGGALRREPEGISDSGTELERDNYIARVSFRF